MKQFFYLFLLLSSIRAEAQTRTVTGTIKNADNNEPVPGCTVQLIGANTKTVLSDKRGAFEISFERDSTTPRLVLSHTGYRTDSILISPGKNEYHFFLRSSYNSMNEVVVSGTMKAISKLNSPIPVEVYTQAFFKRNPSPTLFESLNMISGIQPQINCNVCNTGDIHINGLEGPYTMILIDGMPIVSSLSTVYGLHGIPQSILNKVEVVKGPASTLYGSEAVAGLVNVLTKDPATASKFTADVMATTLGEYNTDLTTKWQAGKNVAALLGVNYFHYWTPKDINKDNFTDVTQQKRLSVFNKWGFKRKGNRYASAAMRFVAENRWGGELQWNEASRGSGFIYGESIYTNRLELLGTYDLPFQSEHIKLDYSYNYHHQDSYYGTTKYLAKQHTAFSQLVWDKQLGKVSFLAGIPFRFIWYDDNSIATADSVAKRNKPNVTYLPGVFLQNEFEVNSRLTFLTGLRYDYNSIHGSIWTPRLSAKYSPDAFNTLRLTGGSGYRVVNLFTEDHAALTGARDVVITEDLKPEQSWNVNFNYTGWGRLKGGTLTVDASLFYTYFTNQIVGDFLSDPQKIIYGNLNGYAVSKGLTASAELSLSPGIKVLTGLTWMNVYRMQKNTGHYEKQPQLFAPDFSGNFSVSYNFRKAGLLVDWTGKVNSPMYLPVVPNDFRPETSPWHCLMNLQLTKKLKGFELYGGAKNLLNFIPKNPILRPDAPFENVPDANGYTFDPSYNYAPIQGIKGFLGVRLKID